MNSLLDKTVGELVAQMPSRSRLFERHGIDYCCGGKRSLREATTQAGVDIEAFLASLESLNGALLESLVKVTDRFRPPDSACNTWRALYDALGELDRNTRAHVHLENEVLHPRIRALQSR